MGLVLLAVDSIHDVQSPNTVAQYSSFPRGPVPPHHPWWIMAGGRKKNTPPPWWIMAGGRKKYTGLWGSPEDSKHSLMWRTQEFRVILGSGY